MDKNASKTKRYMGGYVHIYKSVRMHCRLLKLMEMKLCAVRTSSFAKLSAVMANACMAFI